MTLRRSLREARAWVGCAVAGIVAAGTPICAGAAGPGGFQVDVAPFFQQYCVKCHGPEKHKGDLTLHTLDPAGLMAGTDVEKWRSIAEKLSTGEMPPDSQPRPSPHASGRALAWIKGELAKAGVDTGEIGAKLRLPGHGNRIDHDALFDAGTRAVAASPARLWRDSPQMYTAFGQRVFKGKQLAQPFSAGSAKGFRDYADLFVIDEPTINQLFRNAGAIVEVQTGSKSYQKDLAAIVDGTPGEKQVEAAIRREFQLVLRRDPSVDELARFRGLYEKNVRDAGRAAGARATLAAVFLLPEALYRLELGAGPVDAHGRQVLAPRELANAIALALTDDGPDAALLKAAEAGQLATAADVRREVERLLGDAKTPKPRIMRFFEEYFGFTGVADVFKDLPRGQWHPDLLINDTRQLIQWVLDRDKEVLRTLLTTDKSFVNFRRDLKQGPVMYRPLANRPPDPKKKIDPTKAPPKRSMEYSDLYGLPEDSTWTAEQPVTLPGKRAGVLTQPSWLATFATNNETHPILRGKWVRERLLGGAVPDLPITVDAKLPDAPEKTLRQRMEVTRAGYCWQCHQKMNPLGLAFEGYNFLGKPRATETVVDRLATQAKQAEAQAKADEQARKKNKPTGPVAPVTPVTREVPLDSTGVVDAAGDPKIEGPVSDAVQMVHRIADSPRVRQVFVRHAFRYWMGRNETLDDAPTLVAADQAYVQSGGSMKALITSLLTSDSFLFRKVASNE